MLLTEYLGEIENTEQEQQLLQGLADLKDEFAPAANIPFAGKVIKALMALGDAESIEEFRQTGHYENIEGFNIHVINLKKGQFSIYPGSEHLKKIAMVAAIIGGVLLLLCLCRKYCRRR
ncbi:MAG: hypothetical protein FWC76_05700 [Defluviitaleaceae bacterium]|nr:hypothetical protein [Defluviitaleaceae bacterium]